MWQDPHFNKSKVSWENPQILLGCRGRALSCSDAAERAQRWGKNNKHAEEKEALPGNH